MRSSLPLTLPYLTLNPLHTSNPLNPKSIKNPIIYSKDFLLIKGS